MEQKRSLFGPLLLIAAGVVWLLVRAETIPAGNLWALTHIWPFLLIAAGLGIILRSYWSYASIALDVLVIGGAMLAIFFAPQFGWSRPPMTFIGSDGNWFVGPAERGSGNVVTESREVSNYDAIELSYPAEVLIKQGTAESLQIEADDNLLPHLKTQVRNGKLEIFYRREDGKHVTPTKTVKITIVVKDLADVDFNSAGELVIEKLKTDNLDVSLSGAGNLNLEDIQVKGLGISLSGAGSMTASGSAEDLDMNISGFGDFKGADLHTQVALVNISGAGSATVWVNDDLTAGISGAGSIDYYGSASVTKQVSGVGGVNHAVDK